MISKEELMKKQYEMVIGLETHVELKTDSKIFCSCSTKFGSEPNTQICPVCAGFPGSLPVLNAKVVELAVRAGLATNCRINLYNKQDRKNYFYPDLAKAYQISQHELPICEGGYLSIRTEEGEKRIGITRIHIEEDAGKLVHLEGGGSLVDYNRAGVPLIEIVSEPDLRSAEEAKAYLTKLRSILLYADISDAKMNEGSLRCDVNLSLREKGSEELGIRTEMKNLNSFSAVGKAIESEFKRQREILESGGKILQQTRRWDDAKGVSYGMRSKEDAEDYRYFPDPDLLPLRMEEETLEKIARSLPVLPDERRHRYMESFGLGAFEAETLCSSKEAADFFEAALEAGAPSKTLTSLMLTEVFRLLRKEGGEEGKDQIPFEPKQLARLCRRVEEEVISYSSAKKIIPLLWQEPQDPDLLIEREDLRQIADPAKLLPFAERIVKKEREAVRNYLAGKEKAFQALVGLMMKETKGKASPQVTAEVLRQLLAREDGSSDQRSEN